MPLVVGVSGATTVVGWVGRDDVPLHAPSIAAQATSPQTHARVRLLTTILKYRAEPARRRPKNDGPLSYRARVARVNQTYNGRPSAMMSSPAADGPSDVPAASGCPRSVQSALATITALTATNSPGTNG